MIRRLLRRLSRSVVSPQPARLDRDAPDISEILETLDRRLTELRRDLELQRSA